VGNGGEYSMFIGEYEYRVDEKGRVPVPPKFRTDEVKQDGLVLSPSMDKCITIYPLSQWQKLAESLTSGPVMNSKQRRLSRAIFATAFNTELDAQGRISIPAQLRKYAEIEDEVFIIGTNLNMEIWSKQRWEEEKSASQEEAYHIIETLERR